MTRELIEDFVPFFEHWKGLPHQIAAARQFWEAVPANLKKRDASWYETWEAAGKQETSRAITNPIRAPFYSQRDSATAHALRMCFSSSCAMLLEAVKPGTLTGPNGDDAYLGRVLRYGDTTDPMAQLKALGSYGIEATFTKHANWVTIEQQIDKGIPVPLGFLHHGPASAPRGGGHWLCCIGYRSNALVVHDPFGEINLAAGGYLNNWGARLSYSHKNFGPRWMVEGPGSGWAIIASL
ncbi:MAG: C39 family peptidase [Synechococcus sp.]